MTKTVISVRYICYDKDLEGIPELERLAPPTMMIL